MVGPCSNLPRRVVAEAEEKVVADIRQFDWNLHFQEVMQKKRIEKDFEEDHPCLRLDWQWLDSFEIQSKNILKFKVVASTRWLFRVPNESE